MPWSYSTLTAFETCPRRYYLTKVAKTVTEPQTEATLHGNAVHKALEISVRDQTPLPTKYQSYTPLVNTILRAPGAKYTELKFGLTRNLTPTGFFANDVWCRGVLDLQIVRPGVVTVLDWKTGKPKPDADQLMLFAGATFAYHPTADKVRTGYAWLAHNKLDTETFTPDDVPRIWAEFAPRVQRMDEAAKRNDYPPKPSGLCKAWCPVPKAQCEFSGKS